MLSTQPFAHVRGLDEIGIRNPVNISTPERIGTIAAGAALSVAGLARRSLAGSALAALGGLLLYRGISGNCRLYSHLNEKRAHRGVPGNRGEKVERTLHISRPPSQVYHYWRKLENLPKFMPHLKSVVEKSDRVSHWTVEAPAGQTVEWDAEIINDRMGEMISWESLPGSQVENAGSVWFIPSGPGTDVKVSLQYEPFAGPLGRSVARLFREAPDQQLKKDLARFKELVESDSDSSE